MPLRFDQPSLLGEWKGDPAIIHQALSQIHSASEGEKNRANAKAIAEAKAVKKPSFKISSAESPFSKDQEQIGGRVSTMLNPSISEEQRQLLDQQNLQHAAIAKAQEKQFTGLQQNLTPLQQKWGKNADFSKFNELENKIRTEDDITTRDKNLSEFGALQSRPEDYVNGDGLVIDFHKNMKETPLTYKEDIEKDGRTESKDFTITTKYPTKGEPLLNPDGSQLIIDGNPQFKSREPRSPQELLPYADDLLNSDDDVRKVIYTQTYRKNKDKIESNTKSWAKNMELSGQNPTEEEMQSYMDGQTEKLAKESVATTLFNNDRARIEGIRKVSLDEPKQLQKQTKTDRDNVWDVSSMGAQGSDYNTRVGQKGEIGSFKTHGGVVVKNKNGKKPVLTLNEQTAKNESSGKYEKLVESTDATLDNVRAAYWYKDKAGNRIKDTQKDIIAHLKAMSPKQVVDGDYSAEPVAYLTANKASGTGDLALNPDELKEYNTLKSEFTKDYPSPSVTSPEEKGYDQNEIDRYDRLQELEASKVQKTKTFSVPYGQVEGQLGQLIGEKNASQEALMKSMGEKQYAEYLQGKKILEDKKKEYYNNLNKGSANKKTAEVERKTPDGKIAIFDSNTKQFLRYK